MENDKRFTGSVPEDYDRHLREFLFVPYANDLVACVASLRAGSVLGIASGTGAVTKLLRERLPVSVSITATDLNPDMLSVARDQVKGESISFAIADAQALPYKDRPSIQFSANLESCFSPISFWRFAKCIAC